MSYVTESNLTDLARERWGNIPDPRLREVMTALVEHVHAFLREIEPTEAEWATAIDWLTRGRRLRSGTGDRLGHGDGCRPAAT